MTNVRQVIVLPPTRSKMFPKEGKDSPMNSKMVIDVVLNAHRFQLNSGIVFGNT